MGAAEDRGRKSPWPGRERRSGGGNRDGAGLAPLVQHYAFSQDNAAGGGLAGPPVALTTDLTALAQGTYDGRTGTVGGLHSNIGDASLQPGWGYRPRAAPDLGELQVFWRSASSTENIIYDNGPDFIADGYVHTWHLTLSTTASPKQTLGMDGDESTGNEPVHLVGTPTTTPEHKLSTNYDAPTGAAAMGGAQFCIIDRVLTDKVEARNTVFASFYGGMGTQPVDPDLASLPIPEAGLVRGTPIDDTYWRDEDAEVNRNTVATANDGTLVGTPYSDWATAYKNGGDAWTDTDYVELAAGALARTTSRKLTVLHRVTTPSAWTSVQYMLIRTAAATKGVGSGFSNTGQIRTITLDPDTANVILDTVYTAPTSTELWIVSVFDLDADTIEGRVFDTSGVKQAGEDTTDANVSGADMSTGYKVGRAAGLTGNFQGTIHECRVYDGHVLTDKEVVGAILGTWADETVKRSRHYVGFSAGVRDIARPTALYIPEISGGVDNVVVDDPSFNAAADGIYRSTLTSDSLSLPAIAIPAVGSFVAIITPEAADTSRAVVLRCIEAGVVGFIARIDPGAPDAWQCVLIDTAGASIEATFDSAGLATLGSAVLVWARWGHIDANTLEIGVQGPGAATPQTASTGTAIQTGTPGGGNLCTVFYAQTQADRDFQGTIDCAVYSGTISDAQLDAVDAAKSIRGIDPDLDGLTLITHPTAVRAPENYYVIDSEDVQDSADPPGRTVTVVSGTARLRAAVQ